MKRIRRGTSLTELTVFLSLATVVLSLATGLVHRTFDVYSNLLRDQRANQDVARFARAIRGDLRGGMTRVALEKPGSADSVDTDFPIERLEIERGDGQAIRFVWGDGELTRESLDGGRVVSREFFPLAGAPRCRVQSLGVDGRILLIHVPWNPPVPRTDAPGADPSIPLPPELTLEIPYRVPDGKMT